MPRFTLAMVTVVGIGVSACGTGDGGTGYGFNVGGPPTQSAPTGGGTATLTVDNFLNWCSVQSSPRQPVAVSKLALSHGLAWTRMVERLPLARMSAAERAKARRLP
jgi:hypothetical protein